MILTSLLSSVWSLFKLENPLLRFTDRLNNLIIGFVGPPFATLANCCLTFTIELHDANCHCTKRWARDVNSISRVSQVEYLGIVSK